LAQGEQQLGAGLERAASLYGEIAADQASNNWENETSDIIRDFRAKQGQDAMDAWPEVQQRLKGALSNARNSLFTPDSQNYFDKQTRHMYYYQLAVAGNHYDAEQKTWARTTNLNSVANAVQHIRDNPNDDAAFEGGVGDIMRGMYRNLSLQGLEKSPEALENMQTTARAEGVRARTLGLEAIDPARALAFLDKEGPAGAGQFYEPLKAHLQPQADRAAAMQMANTLTAQNMARIGGGGGVVGPTAMGKVIDYKPSDVLLSGTGMSAAQYDTFRSYLAGKESGSYSEPPNAGGYMGRYQMSMTEITEAAHRLGEPVPSQAEFLGNPQLQEKLFDAYTYEHHTELMIDNPAYAGATPEKRAAILAGAHLGGVKGVGRYLAGEADPADSNGTHVSSYVNGMARALGGGAQAQVQPIPSGVSPPSNKLAAAGFPTREDWMASIPDDLPDAQYNRVYSIMGRNYTRLVQSTADERHTLTQQYKGGIAMLQDGREFSYDPAQYRRVFPTDQAEEMLGNLDDSRTIGQQIGAVRGMSITEIMNQRAANAAVLSHSIGEGYVQQRKRSEAFDKAADAHIKALFADPGGYVTAYNPDVEAAAKGVQDQTPEQAAAAAGAGMPTAAELFAAKTLGEQERLGVPTDIRHVLSNNAAQAVVPQIMSNPEQAPGLMKGMAQQWGSAWPSVWKDLATSGKLPSSYQMVGALDNEGDGALLARALAHANKEGDNKAIEKLLDKGVTGASRPSQIIRDRIAADESVSKYTKSMLDSGASDEQVRGIVGSIELLGQARALYHQVLPAEAADDAVKSALGKFAFLPDGGARIPVDREAAITANAKALLDVASLDWMKAPDIYSGERAPGLASADDWLRQLKAAPTWVTAGNAIRLMDNGGRFVRHKDGGFVEVPFDKAAPAAAPLAAPAVAPPY
jgi:hypothetical protein